MTRQTLIENSFAAQILGNPLRDEPAVFPTETVEFVFENAVPKFKFLRWDKSNRVIRLKHLATGTTFSMTLYKDCKHYVFLMASNILPYVSPEEMRFILDQVRPEWVDESHAEHVGCKDC